MKDFILAALPWVVVGITIAIITTVLTIRKKSFNPALNTQNEDNKKVEVNYISEGMSLGMCFGVAVGSALMSTFGTQSLTYGICFGMLGGMIVGMNKKKK